jgi:predicted nucleic acid-binding protein
VERVFVDANIIFSAAYNPKRRIAMLWKLPQTEIVTSDYAAAEAIRNLRQKYPQHVITARHLLRRTGLIKTSSELPPGVRGELNAKDQPILAAAIASKSNYLLSGDADFLKLFGRVIDGVMVLRPGDYLQLRGNS